MPTFLRELIRPAAELPEAEVCLVGLPLDFGTVLEGGRPGAAGAPAAMRRELGRYHKTYNLEHNVRLDGLRIADAGDLQLSHPDHATNHAHIREQMADLLRRYPRVVVLGGSHDGSYSTVRGLFDAAGSQPVSGINLDAHADVKDKPGLISSGTPFGKLLREGFLDGSRFTEIGLHSNLNTFEDIEFLHQQQAHIVPLAHVQAEGMPLYMSRALSRAATSPAFVSFDVDGCAEAFAPAVSAPSADGFTPRQATEAAFLAGQKPEVRLFEVVEFNPIFDRDNQTARLAATIVAAYLTGVAASLQ
ncbi:arginase family protein [Microvirga sp. STR05]|uniref:Arginase family protein n=1 Tax=Hymenobacter duratus TaxID=2771356 RepID=A0ABR8JIP8_9BACT|nr:arginase family protein [Hymenobacter duratus]MBD2715255.1 arginase family protein [Hymenobacter duratus]MBR7950162.1 arginase family protein [Microvirga sp. STR05]